MQERGRISVNVVTLTGEKHTLFLFPFDSIREEISNLGLRPGKSQVMLVFYQGKQIQPDLSPAALGLEDGDTISIYFKNIKKNVFFSIEGVRFPSKPKIRTPEDEQDRLIDISMSTHENTPDANAFLKIMYERERQKQLEDDSREIMQPQTIIGEQSEIQTLPLPLCFDLESSEFGREYQINPTNLSPLNPLRRNFFPDAPSGR